MSHFAVRLGDRISSLAHWQGIFNIQYAIVAEMLLHVRLDERIVRELLDVQGKIRLLFG